MVTKRNNKAVRLSMRKRLSEKMLSCKQWFSQKVQLLRKQLYIFYIFLSSETETKKPTKTKTKKSTTTTKAKSAKK